MRMGTRAVAVCAVVCLHAGVAAAQSRVMTLAEVLARAREQAPQIVSARLALEEARGRLVGASLRSQANPQIDVAVGNRNGTATRFTDFELGLGQSFEPGARRSARIAGANAAIAQSSANVEEVTRTVLRLAASAYYRAVHANERIKLLNATHELASARVFRRRSSLQGRRHRGPRCEHRPRVIGARQSRARGRGSLQVHRARRAAAASRSRERRRCGRFAITARRDGFERRTSDGCPEAGTPSTRGRYPGSGGRAAAWDEPLEAGIRCRRALLAGRRRSHPPRRHDRDVADVL